MEHPITTLEIERDELATIARQLRVKGVFDAAEFYQKRTDELNEAIQVLKNFIKADVSGEFLPDHSKILTGANRWGREYVLEKGYAQMTKESCLSEAFYAGAKWMKEEIQKGKNFR